MVSHCASVVAGFAGDLADVVFLVVEIFPDHVEPLWFTIVVATKLSQEGWQVRTFIPLVTLCYPIVIKKSDIDIFSNSMIKEF
ncbi:MAG: hypothetical protein WCK53_12550 [Methanomicrobiales archaeon]